MRSTIRFKLMIALAGALAAGIGVAWSTGVAYSLAAGGHEGVGQSGGQEGAGESGAQDPQNEEQFELATRERIGQEGQRVRVGDTQFIFNTIFEFTDSANDLFVWGWLPTISGQISDNAFLGGQKVDIGPDAIIGGDLFLFAQTSLIEGQIGGDIYAFAAELTIAEGAVVGGAIYGSSAAVTIDGDVGAPLSFAGGAVTLNGPVRGDVRLEAGELVIGPNAVIEGDLRYESPRQADIDADAVILGERHYFEPQEDDEEGESGGASSASRGGLGMWGLLWDGWWLLSSFIVGAMALAIGGERARKPAEHLAAQPALGLGFGFVVAVVFPAAALLAMILLVTIPLGLIGLALYLAAAYLARLVAAQTVGDWLLRTVRGGADSSAYASLALGLVLFYVLTRIPYVGFLVWLAAIVAGLGGIFLASRRSEASPPPATPGPEPAQVG